MTQTQWQELLRAIRMLKMVSPLTLSGRLALESLELVKAEQDAINDATLALTLPPTDSDLYLEPIGLDD